jgi:hypothetical protein
VIYKPKKRRGLGPSWTVAPQKKTLAVAPQKKKLAVAPQKKKTSCCATEDKTNTKKLPSSII